MSQAASKCAVLVLVVIVGFSHLRFCGAQQQFVPSKETDESLASLRREIHFGAEFFVNRTETKSRSVTIFDGCVKPDCPWPGSS